MDTAPIRRIYYDSQRQLTLFQKNYISVSQKKYYSLNDLQRNPPEADAYIVGSDQVWSRLLSDTENEVYYLNFGNNNIRRISYAPSFSMAEYPAELRGRLKDCLSRLDNISCREFTGVEICNNLGFKNVGKVLDPTFLVSKNDYVQLMGQTKPRLDNFYFIYSLNIKTPSELSWENLKNKINEKNVIVTFADGYIPGDKIFGTSVVYSFSTLPEWLSNIFYSEMVITPSFHGIALSIILEKDFVYVPLKGKHSSGNSRVLELLESLELKNRILSEDNTYDDIASRAIDWGRVNELLSPMIARSKDFLYNSLQ
jgi:hypothetical protein